MSGCVFAYIFSVSQYHIQRAIRKALCRDVLAVINLKFYANWAMKRASFTGLNIGKRVTRVQQDFNGRSAVLIHTTLLFNILYVF